MQEICPICNGLYDDEVLCTKCGKKMDNAGKLEDYQGPYSPYIERETFLYNNGAMMTGDNCCIHLYQCSVCSNWQHNTARLKSM